VVSDVGSGVIAPEAEFIGTVFYREVSLVASEVRGRIEHVAFEDADRVAEGDVLVRIGSEILRKSIDALRASHEEVLSDLEKAGLDLARFEKLFTEEFVSEQVYDDARFRVKGLQKRSASIAAEIEALEVELGKKTVKAPFAGLVVKKSADVGEWLEPGSPVATLARDDEVDVFVDVPEGILKAVKPGRSVHVSVGGKRLKGRVAAVIPRGDVTTRTFPVKVRVKNTGSLIEGMEARVTLPTGAREKALMVPRDALITMAGKTVVFTVDGGKAKMVTIKVIGYSGRKAGVEAGELSEGMKVVVKGNERLRDGQAVNVGNGAPPASVKD
jgi:RND family efflux transporter MFP subunit